MRKATRKLTDDPAVLRILEQLKLQGKTEREVEEGIGLASGAFTRWKYVDSKSYMTYIGRIADYLNLTAEYLLDTEDSLVERNSLSESEVRLIKMFRKIDTDKQNCLLKTVEYFLEAEGNANRNNTETVENPRS